MAASPFISRYFGPSGVLRTALPGFMHRPQQQTVAAAIDAALSRPGSIALLEAGTGVGKTLAYLLPALHRARPNGRIVVSTHTLALQAQLAEKDIPLVQTVWKKPIEAAVVKGRGNYLCLQDLDAARSDLWTAGDPQFAQIGRWSRETETGDVSELDFTYLGWADIRANADTCKGQDCRFFDRCFYYRMRREAQEATLLLVNHALFFSDLAVRRSGEPDAKLLPDYDFVVFDEAHHLETAAASAFGVAFSSSRLPILMDKVRRVARQLDMNIDRLKAIEADAQVLFAPFVHGSRPEFFVSDILRESELQAARAQTAAIGTLLAAVATEMLKQDTGGQAALKDRVDGLRRQCVRAKEELGLVFGGDDANFVRWGTLSRTGRRDPVGDGELDADLCCPHFAGGVVETAPNGRRSLDFRHSFHRWRLWLRPRTAGHFRNRPPCHRKHWSAPRLNYAKNCLLYVPRHLPMPSDDPGYAYDVANEMIALLEASRGGAFILFTSYRALNAAYDALTQSDLPYPLLRQGEMPNARLVQTFKTEKDAILLGTQSFWEGVDGAGSQPAAGHH